jgi:molybdopterin-containing oxidoreductase family iron-sulfur binding subunit
MLVDLDRCTGCGACMLSCAVENNVPPAHEGTTERTGMTWMRVHRVEQDTAVGSAQTVYLPLMCQQCDEHPPCESVCPQKAVEYDEETGIVAQIPVRCLGCRYCMTACPYHARYFNWWDPEWPTGMEHALNPGVSTRMRGVVEKCNLCHSRLQEAREHAATVVAGETYIPSCVESCPTQAITIGNFADPTSEIAQKIKSPSAFRLLEQLGTEPKVYYLSNRPWVREQLQRSIPSTRTEVTHG